MMQPVTPPRTKRSVNTKGLYTPNTPFGKKIDKLQQSPKLLNKQASSVSIISPSLTPRHRSSKKLGDALIIGSSSTSSRALFPPTPSTIGSGRTKNVLATNNKSSPIQVKRRLMFEESEEENDDEPLLKTPTKNLINDELIKEWNTEKFEDDNNDEIIIKKAEFINPFITNDSDKDKSFQIKKNHNPNELILINKKGEKIIKPLDSNYKPKRLFR